MSGPIDFYFDFSSPYGYFAASRIEELAVNNGRLVNWHPVLLGVLFKPVGTAPLTSSPVQGDYAFHDFDRTAPSYDLPHNRPPPLPLSTRLAPRPYARGRGFCHGRGANLRPSCACKPNTGTNDKAGISNGKTQAGPTSTALSAITFH
mgnify:CR=1 FL=1